MIALLVTGHGQFATGMQSTMEFIAGAQENIAFVNFESNSTELLATTYQGILTQTFAHADAVLVLCDLVGGSPFRTATEVSVTYDKPVEIIGGTNLAMLLEAVFSRDNTASLSELVTITMTAGHDGIARYTYVTHQETEEVDGI